MSQQMAARAQLEEMRQRGLPSAGETGTDRGVPVSGAARTRTDADGEFGPGSVVRRGPSAD